MPETSLDSRTLSSPIFVAAGSSEGSRYRVRLSGEFDLGGLSVAEAALEDAVAEGDLAVLIDLSELTFMDSTGLRFLILARARCSQSDRRLVIRQGGPAIRRLFELTRLDMVLEVEE